MSGLIWIQTVWHSEGIPENLFRKSWFWKKKSAVRRKQACKIKSLPASVIRSADNFSANSLEPDQAPQNVGPDLVPNCLTLWRYTRKSFSKKLILKKNQLSDEKKHAKLTLCLLVPSDLLITFGQTVWNQIRPDRAWSVSKLFDTLKVYRKIFFEKSWCWKKNQLSDEKKHAKLTLCLLSSSDLLITFGQTV